MQANARPLWKTGVTQYEPQTVHPTLSRKARGVWWLSLLLWSMSVPLGHAQNGPGPNKPGLTAPTPASQVQAGQVQAGQVLPVQSPPAALKRQERPVGWRIVRTWPRDLLASGILESSPELKLKAQEPLAPGLTLRTKDNNVRVWLEYYEPVQGMLVQHELSGQFEVTLEAYGQISVEDGSVWTRLYRSAKSAAGKLFMNYEGVPAGFGSTEVVFERTRGLLLSHPTLMVLEGKVTYSSGGRRFILTDGQAATLGNNPGRPRAASVERLAFWRERGSEVLLETLGTQGLCPAQAQGLKEAVLISDVCFPDANTRNQKLVNARKQLGEDLNAQGWKDMGDAYFAGGQLPEAIDSYRRAAQADGNAALSARALLEQGNALWLSGEPEEATRAWELASATDVGLAAAWNNLGVMRWREDQLEDARNALKQGVKLEPGRFELWRNLGKVLLKTTPQDAMLAWQRASSLNPNDKALLQELAQTQLANGRDADATQTYEKLLKLDPAQPEVLRNLAEQYERLSQELQRQGKQREALQLLERALELRMRLR
ncbi:MAG: tetratricopeptide repeat protein [Myxococcota bacterium]